MSFNTKDELRVTLRSLLDHAPTSGIEFRVTVLDNGSSDGSPDMVAAEFPDVELVRSDVNLGFARANNVLADRSSADYLLLLNSDVVVEHDIVTPLLDVLRARPEVIAAGPRLISVDRSVQHSAHRLPTLPYEFAKVIRSKRVGRFLTPIFDSRATIDAVHEVELTERGVARDPEFLWATCWLLSRADVSGGPLFDPSFAMYDEDLDFCRRAAERRRRLAYVTDVELMHIGGASTPSSTAKQRLMSVARRRYYLRHHGRLAAAIYTVVVPAVAKIARAIQRIPRPGWRRIQSVES